jgi:hypothetical protein
MAINATFFDAVRQSLVSPSLGRRIHGRIGSAVGSNEAAMQLMKRNRIASSQMEAVLPPPSFSVGRVAPITSALG